MEAKPQQIFKTEDKVNKTLDGFQNFVARLGVAPRGTPGAENNLISQGRYELNLITRNRVQLEYAYRGSWIVGQVIDCKAEDMVRSGIDITCGSDADEIDELKANMHRVKLWQSLCDTIKWGDLYGGSIAVMQIDGQDPKDPIDMDSIEEGDFKGLTVYDRWQLYPVLSKLIESGPDMGLPAYYDIVLGSNLNDPGQIPGGQETTNATGQVRVHHSRCVRMDGHKLPFFQAITEMMWGESVLERMWDRLIAFDDATMNCAGLIHRASLRTVGIDGLREILAAGGEAQEALTAQFEMMRLLQSNEGITLLDKEDTFQSTAYSFAGLSDMMIQFGQQVSGAAQIPLVRLFGQSPAGMSATGESDIRLYYDGIRAKQESHLRNPLTSILKVMWRSMTGDQAPEDLQFTFTPLWQMSAMDKATIAKTNTDTIIEAHQEGAIDTATMMQELKQTSGDTGIFTHITDEAISDAENEEPPVPEAAGPGNVNTGDPGSGPKTPQEKPDTQKSQGVADFAWRRIKRWVLGDQNYSMKTMLTGEDSETKDYITKSGSKYIVHAESGKKLGEYSSRAEAEKRLKQIEYFKHQGDEEMAKDQNPEKEVKKFEKGTLKSGSGNKVTSKKQALAIGYSEAGEDEKVSDAQIIKDWIKKK